MRRSLLVMAHGHPDHSRGGAEVAAHTLHRLVKASPGWTSHFLAACREPGLRHVGTPLGRAGAPDETLLHASSDHFQFAAARPRDLWHDLAPWVREQRPDVVHLHHYTNFGVDLLRVLRNALPEAPLVLTLHEYLAICARSGQMLKGDGSLCQRATPGECHVCLPQHAPGDYLMRTLYIQSFFDLVDRFVAPSRFLKQRYVDWGIAPQRIEVIENPLDEVPRAPIAGPGPASAPRGRFGYFGQFTPFKGVEHAVEAFRRLPEAVRAQATLTVHGGGHERFDDDYRARIDALRATPVPGLRWAGPYAPQDLGRLMAEVDWVLVPSIWWENSPVVIQEAFRHGRPVICSDIGGMAEKVRAGIDGLHARAGDPQHLSTQMRRAASENGLWERLHKGVRAPAAGPGAAQPLLDLYADLLARPRARPARRPVPSYLLLCSTGRAGSSLLMRQLAQHPDVLAREVFPYETRMRQYLHVAAQGGEAPDFKPRALHGAIFEPHQGGDAQARSWCAQALASGEAARLDPTALADAFYREIARLQGRTLAPPRWVVEKSIGVAVAQSLLAQDAHCRALFLLRDPRDTFFSMKAFNRKARHSAGFGEQLGDETMLRNIVGVWKAAVKLEAAHPGRVRQVRYEDLLRDAGALEDLYRWLGVPLRAAQAHALWTRAAVRDGDAERHSTTASAAHSLQRWKQDASAADHALFQDFAEDFAAMGYTT